MIGTFPGSSALCAGSFTPARIPMDRLLIWRGRGVGRDRLLDTRFVSAILKSSHSKIICCDGGLDNFTGVLFIKDYLLAFNTGHSVNIPDLLIQPLIIPENVEARRVLQLFRQKQTYFCIVVNEYGSFEGIITLHDIVENIIGDMPEEGDSEEPDIYIRDDKSVLVSGDAPVEILDGIIEGFIIDFEEIDYSTVAGFVLSNINKVPQIGDKFEYKHYLIEIVDIDGNRVDKVLISRGKLQV